MATWAKIKIYYDNMVSQTGAVVTATSSATNYPVSNITSTLEGLAWKANDVTDPCYVTIDTNRAARSVADYVAIASHNLGTLGASMTVQWSTDATSWTDLFTAVALRSDKAFVKEFTNPGSKRYWRLKITGHKQAPQVAILFIGLKTEFDYASTSFDPHAEEDVTNDNLTYGGYLAGLHIQYTERAMDLRFEDVCVVRNGTPEIADGTYDADGTLILADGGSEITLYDKFQHWRANSGNKNFFIAWETANSPDDVFLMRPSNKYINPLKLGGSYRDLNLSLVGRKE